MTSIHEPLNDLISSNSTYNSNISPALNNYLAQINQLNIPQYLQYSDTNSNYQMGFNLTSPQQASNTSPQILTSNNQSQPINNQISQNSESSLTNIENNANSQHTETNPIMQMNSQNSQSNSQSQLTQINQQMSQTQIPHQITPPLTQQMTTMNQLNQQVNQLNPQMTQQMAQMNQLNQQVPQINPQLSQINPQMTQMTPQMNHQMVQMNPQMTQMTPQLSQMNPQMTQMTPQMVNMQMANSAQYNPNQHQFHTQAQTQGQPNDQSKLLLYLIILYLIKYRKTSKI